MDEAEWLACTDPWQMLRMLRRHRTSERKWRLFAVACCRRVWHLLLDERSRSAVEMAERFADGLITDEERETASRKACRASIDLKGGPDALAETTQAFRRPRDTEMVYRAALTAAFSVENSVGGIRYHLHENTRDLIEEVTACGVLREVFGNPFRSVALDPAWQTSTVVSLAQAAYEERILPAGTLDPDRLAVLADALEDGGCDNADILNHLRGPGPHYRGCWSLDLCPECVGGVRMLAWEVYPCKTCGGTGRLPNPLPAHLRGPGPHVRGCWALDLLLGKE